jgi:DNA-binding MarR family transcriptional regulator
MQAAEKLYQKSFKEILATPEINAPALRVLIYLYSELTFGEAKQIVMADVVKAASLHDVPAASNAMAKLEKLGYIDRWRKGRNVFVRLLVEE